MCRKKTVRLLSVSRVICTYYYSYAMKLEKHLQLVNCNSYHTNLQRIKVLHVHAWKHNGMCGLKLMLLQLLPCIATLHVSTIATSDHNILRGRVSNAQYTMYKPTASLYYSKMITPFSINEWSQMTGLLISDDGPQGFTEIKA